jgi:hypothetical protein
MFKIKTFLGLLILGASLQSQAQTAFSASSHSATIQGNKYEYTIGEMTLVSTERNSHLIITQGYLQPTEGNKPTDLDNANSLQNIKVYPNPTQDVVNFEMLEDMKGSISYQLYDVAGKVLLKNDLDQAQRFTIDMQSYAIGNYYVLITLNNATEPIKYTYKIQKK